MTFDTILSATAYIRQQLPDFHPEIGIILGTGLGHLAGAVDVQLSLPYASIPHFPLATAESHSGKLLLGTLGGRPVVCLQGRFHYYEGYTMQEVTFPVRVLRALGVQSLLVSNAAGGLNPAFHTSDLMLIEDHISLFLPESPLRGQIPAELGPRWPDMSRPYDDALLTLAKTIAAENQLSVQTGTYVSVPGPQLETRAEYRALRMLGADAVGMSTVPEVIVARHGGMRVLACSVITDLCIPETLQEARIEDILAAAAKAEPQLTLLFREVIARMP
ncbi:MAG: purine-nucleoside phosphorylase [Siphonobacter aquaeclarae]|nr:purine-nucleoside phosphorylase [Siphonobacter aquaeclarae]